MFREGRGSFSLIHPDLVIKLYSSPKRLGLAQPLIFSVPGPSAITAHCPQHTRGQPFGHPLGTSHCLWIFFHLYNVIQCSQLPPSILLYLFKDQMVSVIKHEIEGFYCLLLLEGGNQNEQKHCIAAMKQFMFITFTSFL